MQQDVDRRMIGALLRIPFQETVSFIHRGLNAAGYTDLRPAHFTVFQLMPPEGAHLTALAERAQITKQSMGYLVDYLEERGYVERVPDPTDQRAKLVRLTERGWALDQTARRIMADLETDWTRRLGADRMQALRQTLRDLIDTFEEETA